MRTMLVFALLLSASFTDIKGRYVDNRLILAAVSAGMLLIPLEEGFNVFGGALFLAGEIFLLLLPFFALRFIGAGDIKLLMAVSLFIGRKVLLASLPMMLFSALCLAAATALYRRRLYKFSIPFTVPISIGILSAL